VSLDSVAAITPPVVPSTLDPSIASDVETFPSGLSKGIEMASFVVVGNDIALGNGVSSSGDTGVLSVDVSSSPNVGEVSANEAPSNIPADSSDLPSLATADWGTSEALDWFNDFLAVSS
jgi:hypothetical protein